MSARGHRWWRRLPGRPLRSSPPPALDAVLLAEVRAALAAGAAPGAALAAAAERTASHESAQPPRDERTDLRATVNAVRAGQPLADAAAAVDTGDAATDLLVRALGVAERTGAGSAVGVDQALAAARDEAAVARLLRTRTAQARGTAVILTVLPLVTWVALIGLDRATLAFYTTPVGIATGLVALLLAGAGQWWARRLIRAAGRAAAAADPLAPARPRPAVGRALALAGGVLLVAGATLGPLAGVLAAAAVAAVAARRRPSDTQAPPGAVRAAASASGEQSGGAAEAVELVAVGLAAGLSPYEAVAVAGRLAPPRARPVLVTAARRMRAGWQAQDAFAGSGLAALGSALTVSARWGAPAEDALRGLAGDLRADRRAAAEQAAERTQLSLVFPTTLLTLPAFVVGVVPPLLWTAFTG